MAQMMGYCGLVCSECPAYTATQANDVAAMEKTAAKFREQFGIEVSIDALWCDGCATEDGRHCGHCRECAIRACARERSVATCAECADYGCERLAPFHAGAPHAKANLDALRAGQ
jgi:hypothetical protein